MRLSRTSALLLTGVLSLAGCGSNEGTKTVTVEQGRKPAVGSTTPAGKTGSAPSSPEHELAGRAGQIDGQAVRLAIVELKRSGATTALSLRLTTESPDRAQVASTFDDGLFQKMTGNGATSISGGDSLDGISLIDAKNRKRYQVGRDPDGACACDSDLGSAFVDSDGPLTLSATFAAPPSDVTRMDVVVPKFGTFKDVPLG